jgi:predicted dinucleotide-binding enzyme
MQVEGVDQQIRELRALEEVVLAVPVQKIVTVQQELMEQSAPDQVVVVELLPLEIQALADQALLLFVITQRQQPA